ncbi:unnamed protein product [Nippostrongylus brasiliensis]|uniref:Tnp_DDE_dom domain-containing protein n=1 Tax=Nippostrongylus brasiliensis TaxID=27835 RepID=A0A0N4YZE9_NIPBR|nr:unnamed protein product [Nippostrongylus brasiliensis]
MLDLMGTAIDGRNVRPCDEWIAPRKWLKSRRSRFNALFSVAHKYLELCHY